MVKVILIVGLPGSGKSYLGNRIAKKSNILGFFDDISVIKDSFKSFKYCITNEHKLSGTIIVADVFLCEPHQRVMAEKLIKSLNSKIQIEWVFFENAPTKCRKNVKHRNDGRDVEASIVRFSKSYVIPEGITPQEVWCGRTE